MSEQLQGYSYIYRPPKEGSTTIFLTLHGTGGNEHDLLPFIEHIDPSAGILSPKGNVVEKGHARFFASPVNGQFDNTDIEENSKKLVKFVNEAAQKHSFDRNNLIWVGYSNGANITSSVMIIHPSVVQKAILLRPMMVYTPQKLPILHETSLLVASGKQDPLVPVENTERLIHMLHQTGALLELFLHDGGHHLEDIDTEVARSWYRKQGFQQQTAPVERHIDEIEEEAPSMSSFERPTEQTKDDNEVSEQTENAS